MKPLAAGLLFVTLAWGGEPSAEEIMSRVAANQDRAEEMRSAFVYQQAVRVRFHRGNGKLAREELSEFTVTPTANGTSKTRSHFEGKYVLKGEEYQYYEPGWKYKDLDLDGEMIADIADELTNDKRSRDGINADLFPLTAARQEKYGFQLAGREAYQGREVYRILFSPKKKQFDTWEGEVLVDVDAFQPVLVTTWWAKGIPLWVQIVFGTNLKHLGFKVSYQEADSGLWFPVTYGGEFELRGLFFYKRKISLALRNSGFQRAEVSSSVAYGEPVR